jgi:hypothetical protein
VAFVALAFVSMVSAVAAGTLPIAGSAVSGSTIATALAEIGSVSTSGAFVRAGTAFCIGSSAGRSFFVTTHRVATAAPELLAILPSDERRLVPVEIVLDGADAGIAILAIGVPEIPHVRLSSTQPQAGDAVTIAGYEHSAIHVPTIRNGTVSAIAGGGSYFVQYDARTDTGDDGGPLVDAKSGDVVGIIDAVQGDEAADEGAPPSLYNNLAISIEQAWIVLAKAPVVLDAATSSDFVAHAATHGLVGPAACVNGAVLVGRAYGAWARAHGAIKSVLAADAGASTAVSHVAFASAAAAVEDRERAALNDAIPAIRISGASSSAKLAGELATAVASAREHDRAIVSGMVSANAVRGGAKASSESDLADAAARVTALYDCS